MTENTSWRKLFEYRDIVHQRYHKIWDIKILRKRFRLIIEVIQDEDKILDIGASNRNFEHRIKEHFTKVIYKSMDVDRSQYHDFYSLDEIDETFDVILLIEVIEHMELEEGLKMLTRIHTLLKEKGCLIITTPNIFNPSQFWRDSTHKVAYCYDELGGILLEKGFEIKSIYRTYNDALHKFFFRVYIMAALHRYLGIDFTKSIVIVAQKEEII